MPRLRRWLLACCLAAAARAAQEPDEFTSLLQIKGAKVKASSRARSREASSRDGAREAAAAAPAQDVIYHVHIPKCAGISFGLDAMRAVGEHGLKLASREGCLAYEESDPRVLHSAVLLRKPRGHVISQFDFCHERWVEMYWHDMADDVPRNFEVWARNWTALQEAGWSGDFTPPAAPIPSPATIQGTYRAFRQVAWSLPPFSPEPSTVDRHDWPNNDGGGTIWHYSDVPHHCYSPISMQSQRMTCGMPLNYTTMPDAALAVEKMQSTWFVGLVEAYQASACLLRVKLGEALPAWCDCKRPDLWNSAPLTKENVNAKGHHESDFSPEVLALVDKLTEADRILYVAARERFVKEIRGVERQYNTTILCNEEGLTL